MKKIVVLFVVLFTGLYSSAQCDCNLTKLNDCDAISVTNDCTVFVKDANQLFDEISNDFDDPALNQCGEDYPKTSHFDVYEFTATSDDIFNVLSGIDLKSRAMTQTELINFVKQNKDWVARSQHTFFPILEHGKVHMAYIYRIGDYFSICLAHSDRFIWLSLDKGDINRLVLKKRCF